MGKVWEIDYYSRPILDERGKKVWEVLVCETPLDTNTPADSLFRYAQFCPSTQVNSAWLRTALEAAIAQANATPQKIRFFRRQMNNMIVKACEDAGIVAQPSRRTYALYEWLQERIQSVYPQDPNYQPGAVSTVQAELPPPSPLPDALIAEKWAFVTLDAATLREMSEWDIGFGEAFPLIGLTPTTKIPGMVLFSSRALPLAGWMSGIEPTFIKFDGDISHRQDACATARLLLEAGANDSWILPNQLDKNTQVEAARFEAAKEKAQGVHFLAIQSDRLAESFAGFWLLRELRMS